MSFHKLYFLFVFFVGAKAFGQTKPNATPYTNEATYEKFKKKYPFITSLNRPVPSNILIDKDIEYANINGLSLKADIYYPKDQSKKYPGIALVHGGGWISGSKENEKFMAQELASKGYVAIAVGYRLSEVAKYPAAIDDVNTAIEFLKKNRKKYSLNTKKMAILGESAGAQIATLVGVKSKGKIKAIVNVDGVVSFIHEESGKEGTYDAFWLGYAHKDNPEIWKDASPLEFVDKNTAPTLFINSSQPRFHAGRDDMMKKLKSYGTFTEFHEIKDTPHSFWSAEPWFTETLNLTVDFLDKMLK
ncbi:alpha/beta hydrolase [Chryseobacterium sp. Ch-15]|uniref:Alpha/beta hydrolase n=1 Tax=Chryseobacterium muglaense TaxID=2893752 RepID=A0A9Q3YR89_9FLAO|nr:alpha/beta hydrolase [Chryseobacterium muglaense]MBD3903497.1 alpha/beta hydrolase [Chryseobacterium muglaense]MCC9034569.1 alpha/beta hydrolase [Chryseobacterium muglaense]MCM2552832.1 alpha/beta hydrolase [Chryseobacterium muglaense]